MRALVQGQAQAAGTAERRGEWATPVQRGPVRGPWRYLEVGLALDHGGQGETRVECHDARPLLLDLRARVQAPLHWQEQMQVQMQRALQAVAVGAAEALLRGTWGAGGEPPTRTLLWNRESGPCSDSRREHEGCGVSTGHQAQAAHVVSDMHGPCLPPLPPVHYSLAGGCRPCPQHHHHHHLDCFRQAPVEVAHELHDGSLGHKGVSCHLVDVANHLQQDKG